MPEATMATVPTSRAVDPVAAPAAPRLHGIDVLRGLAMVLMAIDHVRVYSGLPAGGPTAGIFLTRWVTHFCAPIFVFLAGTSAFLYARRRPDVGRFLATRGLWLVLLEMTVVRISWTFNLAYDEYLMAGVLWVLGWSMLALALLARLPLPLLTAFGVLVVAGHDALDPWRDELLATAAASPLAWLWKLLYFAFWAGPIELGERGPELAVLYTLVPWVGVMALGYAFGSLLVAERRDRWCRALGLGAIAAFLVLRGLDLYGDPRPWREQVTAAAADGQPVTAWIAFLDTSKYPASLAFLLMTLGPAIAALPWLESVRGRVARWLALFGRVPLFFYLLHIPLIHLLALGVSVLHHGRVDPWLFANHPMGNPPPPDGYPWSLGTLYAVWAVALVVLTPACAWFAAVKGRRGGWLRWL